jgi:hypothetical protein
MAIGRVQVQKGIGGVTIPVFTEVETYNLADIWGQKGWFLHPSFTNPAGRHTVVGGSQVEGVQSISLKDRAGVQNTYSCRETVTPVLFPYARMELAWKLKILSTMSFAWTNNLEIFPNLPANPAAATDGIVWFGVNNGAVGKVEMWVGSAGTSLWETTGYHDNVAHSYKWVVISQGPAAVALNEFYVDDILVASRLGGGGSFDSPSSGDVPNSFSHLILSSNMNNDAANADKIFYDSIQIKITR